MKIKILKIIPKEKNTTIDYELAGHKRSLTSSRERPESFLKTIDALSNVALNICELKQPADEYTVTAVEMSHTSNKKGESEACEISIQRGLKAGKLKIKTPKRYLVTNKSDVLVLDDISQNAIREVCDSAEAYIRGDDLNKQLYSQAELSLEGEAKEAASGQ